MVMLCALLGWPKGTEDCRQYIHYSSAASWLGWVAACPPVRCIVQRLMPCACTRSHAWQVISIAAGVTLNTMEQALGPHVRVVRVMPNTPALGALLLPLNAGCLVAMHCL